MTLAKGKLIFKNRIKIKIIIVGNVGDQQDIIPISFGDTTGLTGAECNTSDQYSRSVLLDLIR